MFRRAYYPLRELKGVCCSFLSYVRCIGERKQIMIILIILTVTSLGPKAIIIPGVPFSPLHLRFTLSYPTWATFLLSLKKMIRHFIKRYCNDLDITLVFSSFKISFLFGVKDPVPDGLRSRVVYKFVCAGCNACYVGETCRHFSTRVREHLVSDRASHIFKHLKGFAHCRALCSADNFHASTGFQPKIKEAIHIQREQPSLNQQLHPVNLKLSF